MFEFGKLVLPILLTLPLLLLFFINKIVASQTAKSSQSTSIHFPKAYPLIGHLIAFLKLKEHEMFPWVTALVLNSPSSTFTIHRPFGLKSVFTANPATVKHILKTKFPIYHKGPFQKNILQDLLGDGIFNVDSEIWKFQRQVASHEFSTKSLRKFIEKVVDTELFERLIPILSDAAKFGKVLDLQDILQRFTFDTICKIAFGYDPEYLSPSLPRAKFAVAFENAVMISSQRYEKSFPIVWKLDRFLDIRSEKKLKAAVQEIQDIAKSLVIQKKQGIKQTSEGLSSMDVEDLLSRFLTSGLSNEKFVTDIVISFILAGRDTTSSALTWFFWLLQKNKHVEQKIVAEINKNRSNRGDHSFDFEEVKDMVYTHAALCESMRLYPPVPLDMKEATSNDVLPDGTQVEKGNRVIYHTYAMGRNEGIWGLDWAEYRPERWLQVESKEATGEVQWKFVPQDPYSYPVFHAGPRICLGKEMAFLQMKRIVAGILDRFLIVPAVKEGFEPVYLPYLTAKMQGGFPVRFEERADLPKE